MNEPFNYFKWRILYELNEIKVEQTIKNAIKIIIFEIFVKVKT